MQSDGRETRVSRPFFRPQEMAMNPEAGRNPLSGTPAHRFHPVPFPGKQRAHIMHHSRSVPPRSKGQGILIVLIWAADSRHSRESGNPGLSTSDFCIDAKGLWVPVFAGMTLKTKRPCGRGKATSILLTASRMMKAARGEKCLSAQHPNKRK